MNNQEKTGAEEKLIMGQYKPTNIEMQITQDAREQAGQALNAVLDGYLHEIIGREEAELTTKEIITAALNRVDGAKEKKD